MINVQIEQLLPWIEIKYESKYGAKLQLLKQTFITFYNLTQQIMAIYYQMYEKCHKNYQIMEFSSQQQIQSIKIIVNRTIIILHKLIQNQALIKNKPNAITMTFCQKFIKNFQENLNILCTYYHSFSHCEVVANKFKYEKKKIVEGINKLYSINTRVRQLYLKNDRDLKNIQNQRLFIQANVIRIISTKQIINNNLKSIFSNIEQQTSDFYDIFQETMRLGKSSHGLNQQGNNLDNSQQAIKKLMKSYFRIMQQFYQAQAELEYYMKPLIIFCQQIKSKKKTINYSIIDSVNTFTRISSQLLKPNYSLKNFKKIRMEDFSKSLYVILEQIVNNFHNYADFKDNRQIYGHRMYKQLCLGMYQINQDNRNRKQSEKQKQKSSKQKQKQKQKLSLKLKQKHKQKIKQSSQPHLKAKPAQTGSNSKSKGKNEVDRKGSIKNLKPQDHEMEQQKQKQHGNGNFKQEDSQNQNMEEQTVEVRKKTRGRSKKNKNKGKQKELKQQQQQQNEQYNEQDQLHDQNQSGEQQGTKQKTSYSHKKDKDSARNDVFSAQRQSPQVRIHSVVQEICQCAFFIMDCMKELERVQNSSLINLIQEYKDKLNINPSTNNSSNSTNQSNPHNYKKLVLKLCQYQKFMCSYYRLNENIKEFQKMIKEIVLQEFKIRINIIMQTQQNDKINNEKQKQKQKDKEKAKQKQKQKEKEREKQKQKQKVKQKQKEVKVMSKVK